MKKIRLVHAASMAGVAVLMAASASATPINYNTNAAGTKFLSTGTLVLNDSSGAAASLTFTPNPGSSTGTPSTVNLGDFLLACPTCTTQTLGSGSFFNAFTFDLVVTDTTDGASGIFVLSSTGGTVFSDVSGLTLTVSPLQLGPGTGAWTGNFHGTTFTTTSFTGIPAPNSGNIPGDVTIQGFVTSSTVAEPATLGLVGGALLGLAVLRRKKMAMWFSTT